MNTIPDNTSFGLAVNPTDDDLRPVMESRWAAGAPYAIDQWPAIIAAASVPTKLIPIDTSEIDAIFDNDDPRSISLLQKYADLIDEAIGWEPHFIRLSTRSPKDAAFPGLPITLSGKEAMDWICNSERCMDDLSVAKIARKPIFIALRKLYHAAPGGEFRAYAKGGTLLAISRYDYHEPARTNYDEKAITAVVETFYRDVIAPAYDDVVFDLQLGAYGHEGPLLIEVNPYGLSDPCLFGSYEAIEQEGGFRA